MWVISGYRLWCGCSTVCTFPATHLSTFSSSIPDALPFSPSPTLPLILPIALLLITITHVFRFCYVAYSCLSLAFSAVVVLLSFVPPGPPTGKPSPLHFPLSSSRFPQVWKVKESQGMPGNRQEKSGKLVQHQGKEVWDKGRGKQTKSRKRKRNKRPKKIARFNKHFFLPS